MAIINKGILNSKTAYLRQLGNDWPTAQVTTTSDVIEAASNLYYTNARVYSNVIALLPTLAGQYIDIAANGQITGNLSSFTVSSSNFSTTSNVANTVLSISNFTTANLSEGNNLYYTNARVYSAIVGNLATKANVTDLTTANVAELNNLYYTNSRVYSAVSGNLALKANVTDLTTANVAELNNLYYTNSRARTAYTAGQYVNIDNQGVISVSPPSVVANESDIITVLQSNLSYTLSRNVTDPKNILVINEGLIQIPTVDYTVSGTTLTTTTQYPEGSNIEVRYFGIDGTTTGSLGTISVTTNNFTGNGSNVDYTLTTTPTSIAYIIVNIDGVLQLTNSYSLSGRVLTFSEAPENNTSIDVRIFSGVLGQAFNTRSYTGDGATTNFPITSGFTENNILVFENGVAQVPFTDYTVDTTTSNVVMISATSANVAIQIRELGATSANILNQIINLDLTTSNVIPKAGNTYNLGSTSAPYNKIYLAGSNSLVMGNTTISISGTTLTLTTAGTTSAVGGSTDTPHPFLLSLL